MALIVVVGGMMLLSSFGVLAMANARLRSTRTENAFECKRCGKTFQRVARKGFPQKCAHCGASDWNA